MEYRCPNEQPSRVVAALRRQSRVACRQLRFPPAQTCSPSTTTAECWSRRCRAGCRRGLDPAARARCARPRHALLAGFHRQHQRLATMGRWTRRASCAVGGQRLVFRLWSPRDTVSALVLGVDPLRLRLPDGRISFAPPGPRCTPASSGGGSDARCSPRERTGEGPLRLGYFTGGAIWQASYQASSAGERRAGHRLRGARVGVAARRERRDPAAGRHVSRAEPPARRPSWPSEKRAPRRRIATPWPPEQRVGEFHLYTLPGRTTLAAGHDDVGRAVRAGPGAVRAGLRGARADALLRLHSPAGRRETRCRSR